jgi:sugar phosphate isomerase/epimerase
VRALAAQYSLKIMMLQPFSNFEGWERGSKEREDAFARAKGWIKIMHAVGTDMLQVLFIPPPIHPIYLSPTNNET